LDNGDVTYYVMHEYHSISRSWGFSLCIENTAIKHDANEK